MPSPLLGTTNKTVDTSFNQSRVLLVSAVKPLDVQGPHLDSKQRMPFEWLMGGVITQ